MCNHVAGMQSASGETAIDLLQESGGKYRLTNHSLSVQCQ